jgi:hypothetical protein
MRMKRMKTMTFEQKMAILRPHTPILTSLLTAMHDSPGFAQLDDWVYCCSGLYNNGSYATLGALLSEMLPAYEGISITPPSDTYDGHNAFEEFVINVFDDIARHNKAFNGDTYDIDALTNAFFKDILSGHPDWDFSTEPATDDTGGGRY